MRLTKVASRSGLQKGPVKEFHIAAKLRERYQVEEFLFASTGNVIFANFHAVRVLAQKMNDTRDLVSFPEQTVRAGQFNAMGLIDEILHYVVELYRESFGKGIFREAIEFIASSLSRDELDRTLEKFTESFPPLAVYRDGKSVKACLDSAEGGVSGRELALEEMLLLWLANANPAFGPFIEFFDDTDLKAGTSYTEVIQKLGEFFESRPVFGPDSQDLVTMLRSPAVAEPLSLQGQLTFMRDHWGMLLGRFLFRLLSSLDFLKEEEKLRFFGPGKAQVYTYGGAEFEYERFSEDKEWMPKVVLLAKTTLVWLDQLSKKYGRAVTKLDEIPDEELDLIAGRGFTGLWLIGIWERSPASKRIKQLCGNPEAESSAYSLLSYEIAENIGGWDALHQLKQRCSMRGIRLASDMVPNHTGIDSDWVVNHPDWFVQLGHSPFPSHTYSGENLSQDPRVQVFIEDQYYSKKDAAVTFRRTDAWTGDTRYIYHGNDGTAMPWNDTAQLNFLLPEVREAVIKTILHVASNFPIIRFDAAMTLAKRHFQRLWFPEPGSGGDIPSRSDYGLSKDDFNKAMPEEFWRQVVDRVAEEIPDTLLLAEAFWLMEGYFVRTLGMHRVYNSAFMNMLKKEENLNYRNTIKNTQEFDPDILKRFVNFMNNPDEDTAIAQFGSGDKYFGVCTMLVTMPGLPMIGHGQIEGFTEKYGMEYRKAYWDEKEDLVMRTRHEKEIFPLMKKRYLFAEVDNFLLFDVYDESGSVNENVFAYSNRAGSESALVLYNNSYDKTTGWINLSAARAQKSVSAEKIITRTSLAASLGLHNDSRYFCLFREERSKHYFIRNAGEIWRRGLFVSLKGYENQVYMDFREVEDNSMGHYAQAAAITAGGGFRDIDEVLKEIFLMPLHQAFRENLRLDLFTAYKDCLLKDAPLPADFMKRIETGYRKFLKGAVAFSADNFMLGKAYPGGAADTGKAVTKITAAAMSMVRALIDLPRVLRDFKLDSLVSLTEGTPSLMLLWALFKPVGSLIDDDAAEGSCSFFDEWLLTKPVSRLLEESGLNAYSIDRLTFTLKVLLLHQDWYTSADESSPEAAAGAAMETFISCDETRLFLGENRFEGILYFNRECYEEFIWWMFTIALLNLIETDKAAEELPRLKSVMEAWISAEKASGYKVQELLGFLREKAGL
ncbi:MAG: alpha-amylase [Spirochaetales bacterium]|nr:MAG: alpha-amylase [Spirochaetales bacterium]